MTLFSAATNSNADWVSSNCLVSQELIIYFWYFSNLFCVTVAILLNFMSLLAQPKKYLVNFECFSWKLSPRCCYSWIVGQLKKTLTANSWSVLQNWQSKFYFRVNSKFFFSICNFTRSFESILQLWLLAVWSLLETLCLLKCLSWHIIERIKFQSRLLYAKGL